MTIARLKEIIASLPDNMTVLVAEQGDELAPSLLVDKEKNSVLIVPDESEDNEPSDCTRCEATYPRNEMTVTDGGEILCPRCADGL